MTVEYDQAVECFSAAIDFFHGKLDDPIDDHIGACDHDSCNGDECSRPETAREYFHARGWSDETIDEHRLGWAPGDKDTHHALVAYLSDRGFDDIETIFSTGLFWDRNKDDDSTDELKPSLLWHGRYVLPYFDGDDRPVYAIARCSGGIGGGAKGYGGHPNDFQSGKYAKLHHSHEKVPLAEPIWGAPTLKKGEPVVIAEGIADAISAAREDISVLSPVAKEFKEKHFEPLRALLDEYDVPRVYVVPDAEVGGFSEKTGKTIPTDDPDHIRDVIEIPTTSPGIGGGLRTAAKLKAAGYDTRVVDLPRPGLRKVDMDDYLNGWSDLVMNTDDGLRTGVVASSRPPESFQEYDKAVQSIRSGPAARQQQADEPTVDDTDYDGFEHDGDGSGLWSLDITDVTGGEFSRVGDRGKNPLGHIGDSENYFVITQGRSGDPVAKDYKRAGNPVYNAVTFMLCAAGVRDDNNPEGSLTDEEVWEAWKFARERDILDSDDRMPTRAMTHLALEQNLCDENDIEDGWKLPAKAYNAVIDLVEQNYGIPSGRGHLGNSPSDTDDDGPQIPVSAMPLQKLDRLNPDERRRAAKKRGLEWPTTSELRDRNFSLVTQMMAEQDDVIIDTPTSVGKSHVISATDWGSDEFAAVTGDRPVVHLSATKDARDEAIERAKKYDVDFFPLYGRDEACPVAGGRYDPQDDGDEDHTPITVNGQAASDWLREMCEGRGLPFSVAHKKLEDIHDHGGELPCCADSECKSIQQWETLRDGDHGLIIATHPFAHVPGLRMHTNVVFDERPDFTEDMTKDRIARAITSFLQEVDAPIDTWEAFVMFTNHCRAGDIDKDGSDYTAMDSALSRQPDRDWYFETPDAHTLAPSLARAIFHSEERGNGRFVGKTPFEPPRLDAEANDDDGWNQEWLTIIMTDDHDVEKVRVTPGLSQARSVIGLDAHPEVPLWSVNTVPHIEVKNLMETRERQLWRRYERGLRVVQVGDATHPYGSGEYFSAEKSRVVIEHLRETYGDDFRTTITASSVEHQTETIMQESGIPDARTMHYGEEKSRNDFSDEKIGFVNGCIDPGDDYVLNMAAELGLDIQPEKADCYHCDGDGCDECGHTGERRAHGRGFVGHDSDIADSILASVRENHTAQAVGRYARNADDPSNTATVFCRTDAAPPGLIDVAVPGVEKVYTDKQQAVLERLRDSTHGTTAREIADDIGDISKRHVAKTLKWLNDWNLVDVRRGAGKYGASVYSLLEDTQTSLTGVWGVTLDKDGIVNEGVWDYYTWSFSVRTGKTLADTPTDSSHATATEKTTVTAMNQGRSPPE